MTNRVVLNPSFADLLGPAPEVRRDPGHYHKCGNAECGHVWNHTRADFANRDEFIQGHHCSKCGHEAVKNSFAWLQCDEHGKLTGI